MADTPAAEDARPPSLPSGIEWLIFDLGGVVVDFDPEAAWFPYAQRAPDKEAAIRELVADPEGPRARLSEGRISSDEYFAHVDAVLGMELDKGEHRAIDVSILLGERPEMIKRWQSARYGGSASAGRESSPRREKQWSAVRTGRGAPGGVAHLRPVSGATARCHPNRYKHR